MTDNTGFENMNMIKVESLSLVFKEATDVSRERFKASVEGWELGL